MMQIWQLLLGSTLALALAGCSAPEKLLKTNLVNSGSTLTAYPTQTFKQSVHTFDAIDLNPTIRREQWQARVDGIVVIWDVAGLASAEIDGEPALNYSREWLRRFHRTLPVGNWTGTLLSTGDGTVRPEPSLMLGPYDAMEWEARLDKGQAPATLGGGTLAQAIDKATEMAVAQQGRVALLLVTSWERIDLSAIQAIARYHQRSSHRAGLAVQGGRQGMQWSGKGPVGDCVHAIGVGNTFSREKFLGVTTCSSAQTFDAVAQPRDVAQFVTRTFYTGPLDSDNDGIPDFLDKCPNTPTHRLVTGEGCLRFPKSGEVDQPSTGSLQ
jgi:hypothetical protein